MRWTWLTACVGSVARETEPRWRASCTAGDLLVGARGGAWAAVQRAEDRNSRCGRLVVLHPGRLLEYRAARTRGGVGDDSAPDSDRATERDRMACACRR